MRTGPASPRDVVSEWLTSSGRGGPWGGMWHGQTEGQAPDGKGLGRPEDGGRSSGRESLGRGRRPEQGPGSAWGRETTRMRPRRTAAGPCRPRGVRRGSRVAAAWAGPSSGGPRKERRVACSGPGEVLGSHGSRVGARGSRRLLCGLGPLSLKGKATFFQSPWSFQSWSR